MTSECILLENALLWYKCILYQLFVQNIVFLIKRICIQVVIKHEDRIKPFLFCLKAEACFFILIWQYSEGSQI